MSRLPSQLSPLRSISPAVFKLATGILVGAVLAGFLGMMSLALINSAIQAIVP